MIRNSFAIFAILLVGVGCGGGETLSERGGGTPTRPALPEPSAGSSDTAWSTSSEYRSSNGLQLIRAAEGYATRSTGQPGGQGKTVAVLDTPLDIRHPDLLTAGVRTKAFDFEFDNPDFNDPNIVHGTHVAGTVAARRDGLGVHGVAYNANLVGISVLRAVQPARLTPFPTVEISSDAAAGIASAAGVDVSYAVYDEFGQPVIEGFFPVHQTKSSNPKAEADVLNMSFGTPDNQGQVLDAMTIAARQGKILVAALGNCGQGYSNPQCQYFRDPNGIGPTSAPAKYMTYNGVAGSGIAVGAVDQSGRTKASFSNTCGEVARYCLFAPGSSIYSTIPRGGHDSLSGTSMASPHVAGAAAVVWAAFPNKNARDIVSRLLTTARPLGSSTIYGHGALDLEAALSPSGSFRFVLPGRKIVPVANTIVQVPPGFDVPDNSTYLADTIVYDEQMFPFRYDLGRHFLEADTGTTDSFAQWFLSSLNSGSTNLPMGRNASAHFTHDEAIPPITAARLFREDENRKSPSGAIFNIRTESGFRVSVGNATDPTGFSNDFVASRTRQALFSEDMSISPFSTIAGSGLGLNVGWKWNKDTDLDIVDMRGSGYFGSGKSHLISLGVTRNLGENITLGARYGTLREEGSRMGIRTAGALNNTAKSITHFVDVSVNGRIAEQATLFGGMSHGVADKSLVAQSSLVSNWGEVRGASFLFGSEIDRIWSASDQLILTVSLPFRARGAELTIDLPDKEIEDQVVQYTPRSISLAPRGREKRLQMTYEVGVTEGISLTAGGYARIQPDHDEEAGDEFGAAGKIQIAF